MGKKRPIPAYLMHATRLRIALAAANDPPPSACRGPVRDRGTAHQPARAATGRATTIPVEPRSAQATRSPRPADYKAARSVRAGSCSPGRARPKKSSPSQHAATGYTAAMPFPDSRKGIRDVRRESIGETAMNIQPAACARTPGLRARMRGDRLTRMTPFARTPSERTRRRRGARAPSQGCEPHASPENVARKRDRRAKDKSAHQGARGGGGWA